MSRLSSRTFSADAGSARGDDAARRIHVDDEHDRALWALLFGVTELEIRHAIGLVGPMADAVSHYLRYCDVPAELH